MQSKTFSKISTIAVVAITIYVLVLVSEKVISTEPFPSTTETATTTPFFPERLPTVEMRAPKGVIHTTIASSTIDQEQGLSGRDSLPDDAGLLFVFPTTGSYGFWMKDMSFPLDIVWIDSQKTVVGVTTDLSPATYPSVFTPPSPILYVLELNTGGADKFGIATGTKLVF